MLAKNVNDDAFILDKRGALRFFASKLAPTGGLQRERQRGFDLLALRQAHLKLSRVVNQYVLPGKRFRGNQA